MSDGEVRIGTAGWSIPGAHAALFPGGGSHLERYARVLPAAPTAGASWTPSES